LDFCNEVLGHLLQTCLRQKNSSYEHYLLWDFVTQFSIAGILFDHEGDEFGFKLTRIPIINLDLSIILPGIV
jgi:hypothetical protein